MYPLKVLGSFHSSRWPAEGCIRSLNSRDGLSLSLRKIEKPRKAIMTKPPTVAPIMRNVLVLDEEDDEVCDWALSEDAVAVLLEEVEVEVWVWGVVEVLVMVGVSVGKLVVVVWDELCDVVVCRTLVEVWVSSTREDGVVTGRTDEVVGTMVVVGVISGTRSVTCVSEDVVGVALTVSIASGEVVAVAVAVAVGELVVV
jgi:hypothetical protein